MTVADSSRDAAQALITVASNAQTRHGERVTASWLLPPGNDRVYYQRLDYSQYLDAAGSQLLLSASRYRSEPGTRIRLNDGRDITREHDSERYAIGLRQPVVVRPNEWLAVQGHLYSVSEHDEDRMAEQPPSRKYDTYVRALSFEGDWRKVEQGRLRIVSAGVHQGLDYLGARSDADYDLDFLRLRLGVDDLAAYTERLGHEQMGANCDLPESFVYEATKAVLDNNEKMLTIHKGARTTLAENWDKNTFIPFHPGAAKYYEEKGIKIPANLKLK